VPYPQSHSVVHFGGHDYWRTWFIEECEREQLFGLTERHLLSVEKQYTVGTKVFLEDAPFYHHSESKHRICGPYDVFEADPLPPDSTAVYSDKGRTLVYLHHHPERGPWLDQSTVHRRVEGVRLTFRKIASEFGYFPYRFRIRRSRTFKIQLFPHTGDCKFGW
jgi:hypothetical protein